MNLAQKILILLLRFYQALISPALAAFFGPAGRCRYTPSCSQYARQAIHAHGACVGGALAVKRLCRCHPWAPFGDDPVPPVHGRKPPLSTLILKSSTRHGS